MNGPEQTHTRTQCVCFELLDADQMRGPCGQKQEQENSGNRIEKEWCGRGLRQADPVRQPDPIPITKGNGVRILSDTQFP